MTTTIRPASPSDRERVVALAPRLEEGVAPWRDRDAVRIAVLGWVEDSLDGSSDDDQAVLVAEDDGSIVGFISITQTKHWTGADDAYIGELVVSPDAEGNGVGSALIRSAIEWSRAQGFERVSVTTGAANTRARKVYEKLGFEEEGISLSIAT